MSKVQEFEIEAYFGDFFDEYQSEAFAMLDSFDWDTIEHYMDDDIRERLHIEIAPCSDMRFLMIYMLMHAEKYGEDFEIH